MDPATRLLQQKNEVLGQLAALARFRQFRDKISPFARFFRFLMRFSPLHFAFVLACWAGGTRAAGEESPSVARPGSPRATGSLAYPPREVLFGATTLRRPSAKPRPSSAPRSSLRAVCGGRFPDRSTPSTAAASATSPAPESTRGCELGCGPLFDGRPYGRVWNGAVRYARQHPTFWRV